MLGFRRKKGVERNWSFGLNRGQLGHGSMKALTTEGVLIGISQKEISYVTCQKDYTWESQLLPPHPSAGWR